VPEKHLLDIRWQAIIVDGGVLLAEFFEGERASPIVCSMCCQLDLITEAEIFHHVSKWPGEDSGRC